MTDKHAIHTGESSGKNNKPGKKKYYKHRPE